MYEQLGFEFSDPDLCPVCDEPLENPREGELPGIEDEYVMICRACADEFNL